ncbi:hypothetical protein GPALN_012361 [Globodera pallida]|nr:hypothetical protein GPALN_012361 [Globodera pallida]
MINQLALGTGVHKRDKRPLLDSKPELHVCNICEQVIETKNMQHHIVAHALPNKRKLALPYGCRFGGGKCQFRKRLKIKIRK